MAEENEEIEVEEEEEIEEEETSGGGSLEDMVKEHNASKPAPEVSQAKVIDAPVNPASSGEAGKKENSATVPAVSVRSEFKKKFLGDGFLSGLLYSILVNFTSWGLAWAHNLVFEEWHVDWKDLLPGDKEEEDEIRDLLDMYSPAIMKYLDKLPDGALLGIFIVWGFGSRMVEMRKKIEPKKKEEKKEGETTILKDKATAKEKKETPEAKVVPDEFKVVFVIGRKGADGKDEFWKDDGSYTVKLNEAHYFSTGEEADLVANTDEFIGKVRVKK